MAPLVAMRTLFSANLVRLAAITFVVVPFVAPGLRPSSSWVWAVVPASGVYAVLALSWVRRRKLPVDSESKLVKSYQARFFIGVGVSSAPYFLGFVCLFIVGRLWPFLLGLAFSGLLLAIAAPSTRDIRRCQEQLNVSGSPLSLGRALTEPPRPEA